MTNNKATNRQQQHLWFDFPNKDVSIGSSIGSGTSGHEIELQEEKEDQMIGDYREDDHVVFDDDDDDGDDHDDCMKLVSLNDRQGSTRYEICEQCQLSSRSLGAANLALDHCGSYDDAEFGQSAHEASIATHMLHCPHRHGNYDDEELENEYYNNNEGSGGSSNHFFNTHFNIYSGGRGGNTGTNSSLCCCYRRTLFVLATIGIIALTTTVFFGNTTIHHPTSTSMTDNTVPSNNNNNNNTLYYYGNNGDGQQQQQPQPQDMTVVVVPEAPAELSIACTYYRNDSDNNDNESQQQSQEQTCIELCTVGSCCLMSGPTNCFASNPRTCQDYLQCPIDPTTNQPITTTTAFGGIGGGNAVPLPAMDDLNELCSSASIATEGGRDICHELCIGGLCCIGGGGQDGTANDCSSSQECQAYEPCHSIWSADGYTTMDNGIPSLPLNRLCSSTNLQTTKGQDECSKACQFGKCCFENGGTCLETHPLICDEYKYCPEYEHIMVDSTSTHKQVVPYPINDLDVICTSSSSEDDKQTCIEECLKGTCCFEEGNAHFNCFSDNQESCEAYEICVTVLPSTDSMLGTETVISPVEAICSVENILSSSPEGRELCESICSYGKCCFTENESLSCQTQHLDICESYRSCSLLTVVPEAPDNLAEMCVHTHGHECERICAAASCCFSFDGQEHGPCQPTNVKACASYKGICHTSEGGSIGEEVIVESEEISPLASICSDIHKLTSDESRQQCHEECAPAKCCVALSKDESCYDTNREECEEYKRYCMNMWDVPQQTKEEQQEASSVSPMSVICSQDAILTEEGRSKCSNECDHATCCDAESVAFNCYDSNKEWCDEVSIYCRILD